MDAALILLAFPAAAWALVCLAASTWGVVVANLRRGRELRIASDPRCRSNARQQREVSGALRRADLLAARATREDYSLTGAILAGLGALAMFAGRAAAYGPWAVGLYSAGALAIIGGFGLAIFGAVLRLLARPLEDAAPHASDR